MVTKDTLFPNLSGKPDYRPNQFVQDVKNSYYNNGFTDAFVESSGRKGVGKTAFSLISGYQVYGNWLTALDQLYFTPKEALELLRNRMRTALKTGKAVNRVPFLIIDDATMGLNKSKWWLEQVQDFSEFYSIVRSCCAGIIFTGPSLRLPESIACDIKYKIIIKPLTSEKNIKEVVEGDYSKSPFWRNNVEQAKKYGIKKVHLWRQAKIYSNFTIPSSNKRLISPNVMTSIFPLHYPNNIFKAYDKRRNLKVLEMLDKAIEGKPKKVIGRPMNMTLLNRVIRDRYLELKDTGLKRSKCAEVIGVSEGMLEKYVSQANNHDKEVNSLEK